MLAELPRHCSLGVKKSSKGHRQYWRGYKLHLDVADGQIPITALLTGACLHDSQVAIPLMTITSQRVTYLYELMDAAYDAHAIEAHSRSLGHVPLIAPNGAAIPIPKRQQDSLRGYDKRRKAPTRYDRKRLPFTPSEEQRFALRTMVERVYSRLKDEFGARFIRVRGASKIMAHLMFRCACPHRRSTAETRWLASVFFLKTTRADSGAAAACPFSASSRKLSPTSRQSPQLTANFALSTTPPAYFPAILQVGHNKSRLQN
jgi:hypothetical protein